MRSSFASSIFAASLALSVPACQPQGSGYAGPQDCFVDAPCDTDPSQMCKVPCPPNKGGNGGGHGGSGGSGGSSGTAGAGGSVDVTGKIVVFTNDAFDITTDYLSAVHVIAPGADTQTVETDTSNGTFSLQGAASGEQWVLAQSGGGAGAPFSTFSFQVLDGTSELQLPMVPVAVLDDVAVQIGVPSFGADRAQIVLLISDEQGNPLPGVSVGPLSGATFGYEIGAGEYVLNPVETTDLGVAVALNVSVSSESTVDVPFTYQNEVTKLALRLAPDTVTFAAIAIPTP